MVIQQNCTSSWLQEQTASPATVNVAVTSSSPFAFDTGSGAVSTLEFVDGNTYVFDVSDASMADKTLTIGTAEDDLSSALTSGISVSGTPGAAGATVTYVHSAGNASLFIVGVDTSGSEDAAITTADDALTGGVTQAPATVTMVPVADKGTGTNGATITDAAVTLSPPTVYEAEETFPWGGYELTFYDGSGVVLGYASSQTARGTYTDASGTAKEKINLSLFDENYNFIGHVFEDEYGSGSNFSITATDADGSITGTSGTEYIQESGLNTFIDPSGNTETREFTFNYEKNSDGSMGNFLGGTETNNGETLTFDENWAITGQSKSVASDAVALTSDQLVGVPAALQSTQTDGLTYAEVDTYDWGTETMYYDSTGGILGFASSNSWSDPNYGSGSSVNYMGPNHEQLGSSFQELDSAGNVMASGSRTVTTGTDDSSGTLTGVAAQKYRKEVEEFTDANGTQTRTYYFNDDPNDTGGTTGDAAADTGFGDFMAGTEVSGAKTTELGPNWTVTGETADTSSLTATDLSNLPSAFVSAAIGDGTPQYATNTIVVTFDPSSGANGALLFDGSAIPSDFSMKKSETYIFDTSDSSMAGVDIGFSASADNASDNALTAGITKSGDGGATGSKTTVVLAENHSGEVHIFASEANPTTHTVALTKRDSDGVVLIDGGAALHINEGDTYIFDTSDTSMSGLTVGFSKQPDNAGGNSGVLTEGVTVSAEVPGTTDSKITLVLPIGYGGDGGVGGSALHMFISDSSGVLAGKGTDPSGVGFVITDSPIPFVVAAEAGTAISGSGVTIGTATPTSVTPPSVFESVETFPWGGSETTYYDSSGTILAFHSQGLNMAKVILMAVAQRKL